MTETLSIAMRDGARMGAELAAPKAPGVGIVMIPPIFGVDDGVRAIMADWAGRGCAALFVDMFHRTIPGPLGREGEGREKAQKRYGEFDAEQGVADLADAISWLREDPRCNGKVVVFGYCFCGRYAYLSTTRGLADGGRVVSRYQNRSQSGRGEKRFRAAVHSCRRQRSFDPD